MIAAARILAAALERVNDRFARTPGADRLDVNAPSWRALEAEIDGAFAAGDGESATAAVNRWEIHALRQLRKVAP